MQVAAGKTGYHLAHVQNPGPPLPDGDGGFTLTWADADPPTWPVSLEAAGGFERTEAGAVLSSTTQIVRGRFHRGVSTYTRLTIDGETYQVTGVQDLEHRGRELRATCERITS